MNGLHLSTTIARYVEFQNFYCVGSQGYAPTTQPLLGVPGGSAKGTPNTESWIFSDGLPLDPGIGCPPLWLRWYQLGGVNVVRASS
jgi:hypothetical protein